LAFATVAVTASGHFFLFHFFSDLFMPMPGTLASARRCRPKLNGIKAELPKTKETSRQKAIKRVFGNSFPWVNILRQHF
jgi:hypothetical protein